jgi:hypothetical protein
MNPGILTFLDDRFGQSNVTKMGTMGIPSLKGEVFIS